MACRGWRLARGTRDCEVSLRRTLMEGLGKLNLNGIHWVIVGGESGHGARPLKKEWVTRFAISAKAQTFPSSLSSGVGCGKKRAGRELDGQTYDGFPVRSSQPVSPLATAMRWAREIQQEYAGRRASCCRFLFRNAARGVGAAWAPEEAGPSAPLKYASLRMTARLAILDS